MKLTNIELKFISQGFCFKPPNGCFGYSTSVLVYDKEDNKTILFDTGAYSLRKPIKQLIQNDKIDYVVISHLHFDHCSNLDLFINNSIPILISEKELKYYDEYKNIDIDLLSYFNNFKQQLNISVISSEVNITKNCKTVFTPGHTDGHISLEVNAGKEKILICGDSIKTRKEVKKCPSSTNAFNFELFKQTRQKILKTYKILIFGHDVFNKKFKLRRF